MPLAPQQLHILISWHTWNAWNEYNNITRSEVISCVWETRIATWFVMNTIQSSLSGTVSWGMLFDTLKSSIIQHFSINHPHPCPERRDSRVGALDPFYGDDTETVVFFLSSGASGQVNYGCFLFVGVPHLPKANAVFPLITFRAGLDDHGCVRLREASQGLQISLMWNLKLMHFTWPLQLAQLWFQWRLFLFSNQMKADNKKLF